MNKMMYKYNGTGYHIAKNTRQNDRRDWGQYSEQLKNRGNISIWISDDVIEKWYEQNRIYDGNGAPNLYSDFAIEVSHQIRQVFKLPLLQCEGFVNALFKLMNLDLRSPSYSALSKRLSKLKILRPSHRLSHPDFNQVKNIAIDSSGLQCYEHDSWVEEKYGKTRVKKNWRKLHITVDNSNVIHTAVLTTRHEQDCEKVDELIKPIDESVNKITADAAYDNNPNYNSLHKKFPNADLVIAPQHNACVSKKNNFYRNRNILEIQCYGKRKWKKHCEFDERNYAELAFSRYKRILGGKLHAREFSRQKVEAMIGCSILNKMNLINTIEIRRKF